MRFLKIILMVILILGFLYTFLNIAEQSFYNNKTKGKTTKSDEIYGKCNAILSEKYEKLIYENKTNLLQLYSKYAQKDLIKVYSTNHIDDIRKKFNDFTIDRIEEKNSGIYIIYYYITDIDHQELLNNKLIVKIKNNNGCIYYDKWYGVI
ncbi:MAG: hypothetical protein PHR25_00035 [Clostridia bacterium]|nr:hypothetical protein [Clostridia bacterium]MDD4375163.1 hypothetical protein [Clostridia bacterium]